MAQKVPLHFSPYDGQRTLAQDELLKNLKEWLEEGIYTWEVSTFPIIFPSTLPRAAPAISLTDLIADPDYAGEIYDLAFDPNTRSLRKMDFLQLQEIRRTGEFSVPSQKFPGQVHIWKLNLLLQKGWRDTKMTALKEAAFALKNLIVWIPNRLTGSQFSIPNGIKKLVRGIVWDLPTLLWGWVETKRRFNAQEVSQKVQRKLDKFMLEDLKFSRFYEPKYFLAEHNEVTAEGSVFDFRLYNPEISKIVGKRLTAIEAAVSEEFRKVELKLQKQISNELFQSREISDLDTLAKEVANRLVLERRRLQEHRIRNDPELEALSPGIAKLLMDTLEADEILQISRSEYTEMSNLFEKNKREELRKGHPIKYLIDSWVAREVGDALEKFRKERQFYELERAIALTQEKKLPQAEYFFRRELFFRREREGTLKKALEQQKAPSRSYTFRRRIWNPKNWKITSNPPDERGRKYYYANKFQESVVSSDKLFWRIRTMYYRFGTLWSNSLYYLYRNIVQGPLGIRALFSPFAFRPDTEVDSKTGDLIPGPRHVETFLSRLGNLWQSVFDSRADFERKPDTGFLGKSISRVFNLAWNYIIKGLLGSALIIAFQPTVSILNIVVSTFLVATSMIWSPIGALLAHLFAILIYDFESPLGGKVRSRVFPLFFNVIIGKILYGGFQSVASVVAIVFHLLAYVLVNVGCGIHTGLRVSYDFLVFYLIIKMRGRMPATNSFAAKRIHGPGLSRQTFFQINPDLALVALQVKMEQIELQACEEEIMNKIEKAEKESTNHIYKVCSPLGLILSSDHPILSKIRRNKEQLLQKYRTLRSERNALFPFQIECVPHRDRIGLEKNDLQITLHKATLAVEHFYSTHILPRKNAKEQELFWETNRLLENDWNGLARGLLASVFSDRFLAPLEEVDKQMALKIEHSSVHQYAEGLMNTGAIPDDLSVSSVECPNYYQQSATASIRPYDTRRTLFVQPVHPITATSLHSKYIKYTHKNNNNKKIENE